MLTCPSRARGYSFRDERRARRRRIVCSWPHTAAPPEGFVRLCDWRATGSRRKRVTRPESYRYPWITYDRGRGGLRPDVRGVPRYKKKRVAGFWLERSGPLSFVTRAIARLRHQRRTQIQISARGIRAWLAYRCSPNCFATRHAASLPALR